MESILAILCDGCDGEFALDEVGLEDVPEGDWFCPACLPSSLPPAAAAAAPPAAWLLDSVAARATEKKGEKGKGSGCAGLWGEKEEKEETGGGGAAGGRGGKAGRKDGGWSQGNTSADETTKKEEGQGGGGGRVQGRARSSRSQSVAVPDPKEASCTVKGAESRRSKTKPTNANASKVARGTSKRGTTPAMASSVPAPRVTRSSARNSAKR
jgi:hypothetical protein